MFIYHITERLQYEETIKTGAYYPSDYEKDGFIHCSTREQVLQVANRFYAHASDLVLLELTPSKLIPEVIFENLEGNDEKFPHVYGKINLDAINCVYRLNRPETGGYVFPKIENIWS